MRPSYQPAGYTVCLGEDLTASVHPDGALSLEGQAGAADLSPAQVERLRELLALAGGIIALARRKRARSAYTSRYGAE